MTDREDNHYHRQNTSMNISALQSMLETISQVASKHIVQLKYFEETSLSMDLIDPIGAVYAWKLSSSEDFYMCYTNTASGHLYCGSSKTPVIESVELTSLSALSQDFVVTWKVSSGNAAIFSKTNSSEQQFRRQNLATKSALDSAAFVWNNRSFFLIVQEYEESLIYCRYRVGAPYSLVQRLSTKDARMVNKASAIR